MLTKTDLYISCQTISNRDSSKMVFKTLVETTIMVVCLDYLPVYLIVWTGLLTSFKLDGSFTGDSFESAYKVT